METVMQVIDAFCRNMHIAVSLNLLSYREGCDSNKIFYSGCQRSGMQSESPGKAVEHERRTEKQLSHSLT